jgi:uncharacterized membrane-anchored protein
MRVRASKVPAVIALFWLIKVLTTGMGETTSDYLVHRLGPALAIAVGGCAIGVGLWRQYVATRYEAWTYWLAVVMVAVFGTMVADVLHVGLGIPYVVSSCLFALVLVVTFALWYRSERTLSIHSIRTRTRERFYWATVLATFALGTAVGDMTAKTLNLGYFSSGLLFLAVMAIPAIGYVRFGLNPIVGFWFAYVVTRPLGASFADWVAVPPSHGGLGLGYGPVSLVLAAVIAVLVGYLARSQRDVEVVRPDLTMTT